MVTCRLQGINPYRYLLDVLQRAALHPAKDVLDLTPRVWKEKFADKKLTSQLDKMGGIRVYIDRLLFNGKAHVQKNKLINKGQYEESSCMADFVQHMLSYVDLNNFTPLKIVVNAGNGSAGPALDAIEKAMHNKRVPIEFIKVHHSADGTFPNGIPNPLRKPSRCSKGVRG